jgi:hypothetical protein
MNVFEFLRSRLQGEPPLHPQGRLMAKRRVKERLKRVYPELRGDPWVLEKMDQSLGLELRVGCGEGGATMFEVILSGKIEWRR